MIPFGLCFFLLYFVILFCILTDYEKFRNKNSIVNNMSKSLILVESPTKAKTLYRFLQGKYQIEASMGHIRDLPKGEFGVDVENNFEPKYVIPSNKRKTVENLRHIVKDYNQVILATDPDREGEAIAHHLYFILKSEANKDTKFARIVFHEITENAINEALKNPHQIDNNLVNAQTARRVLDRVVGYRLSPLLWEKIKRGLSAGRVQSVALRLIVEREGEIEKFKSEKYFKISVILLKKDKPIEFELVEINGEKAGITIKLDLYDGEYRYTKTNIDKTKTQDVETDLKNKTYKIIDIIKKETKRSPYPPYITSSLQQDASRRFGFTSKKTMGVAQKLYEEGYITYHRTDSFNISNQFISSARTYIEKEFGKKYLSPEARVYKTKSKVAQEAHEAIRPTNTNNIETQIASEFGRDFAKLYGLIYKRAIATQMADAIFESTKVLVETSSQPQTGNKYLFEKNGSILRFDGFLKLTGTSEETDLIPTLNVNEALPLSDIKIIENATNPPPRYSEAGIIASLEKHGIGRPSTYAPTISTIESRFYVEKKEGRFVPTITGSIVNKFLVHNFADIDDIPFTAKMEDELDNVANGSSDWVPMIKDFYSPFEKEIEKAEKEEKIEIPLEKTGEKCPQCGSDIVIRQSRFGKFYACSKFPECKYKESFSQETKAICPQDGGKILVRKTRRGRIFYGCENYPACKFAVWKLGDINNNKTLQH